MSDTPSKQFKRLRIVEIVGIVTTVVAFALTRVMVPTTVAAESNPVARQLIATLGWTGTGVIAVATVAGAFAVYRRVLNRAPRFVIAASAIIAGIGVTDVLVNLWVTSQLSPQFTAAQLVPITAVAGVGALCLSRPDISTLPGRIRSGISLASGRGARRTAVVAVLVVVAVSPALVSVTLPDGGTMSPVDKVSAAENILDDFNDGDLDQWTGSAEFQASTDYAYEGTHSMKITSGQYDQGMSYSGSFDMDDSLKFYMHGGGSNFGSVDKHAELRFRDSNDDAEGEFEPNGNNLYWRDASSTQHTIATGVPTNEWLKVQISGYGDGDNTFNISVYDSSGTELGNYEDTKAKSEIEDIGTNSDSDAGATVYYDFFATDGATPQYDVSGNVTDTNGDAIESANITVDNSTGSEIASTTTAADGTYSVSVEDGDYTFTADADGYNAAEQSVNVSGGAVSGVNFSLSETSSSTATPTPTGDQFEYTMGVCYEGQAAFDPVGAQAGWLRVESTDGWVTDVGDALTPDTVTGFDQYHQTRNDVYDGNQYNVEVKTDRAHFAFAGLEMSVADPWQVFQVRVPFGEYENIEEMKAAEKQDEWESACNTPVEEENASTPEPTPPPEPEPADELPGELTAIGECHVPDGSGEMKRGILVQYYDPTFSTSEISYDLSYNGMTRSGHVNFETPQGFYQRCDAGGDGIDVPDIGTPEPLPTAYPNGTMPEPTPFPSPTEWPDGESPTPYPNGTIPEPTTYPSPTPYPTPEPTPTDWPPGESPTPYPNGTVPSPTPYPTVEPVPTAEPIRSPTDWPEGQSPTPYDNGTVPSPTPYPGQPSDCPDGQTARTDSPPQLALTATLENGTEVSEYNCGFDYEDPVSGFNGSSQAGFGGALIGEDAGSGAPVWLTAAPAAAAIGYAYYRRRQGGGGGSAGRGGGGRAAGRGGAR